ncbi:hypothetical protein B296_00011319 [Ensete ventricosum]|uniref:Uncharacterized protein n=1 Tax=Ensete ventricosum TaxID=4639 RepID=A0A427AA82_ENSVE|nr:hypothetical protein B296_00011319 [Ensete ventricosum]
MGGQPRPGFLQGQPATDWPPAWERSAVAKAPCKGATGYGQGPLHRGRLGAARPQGWQAPTGTVACRAAPTGAANCTMAPAMGAHQWPAHKGLLARGEAARVTPTCG